jgi:hypothetical protein
MRPAVARVQMQLRVPRRGASRLRHDHRGMGEPVDLEILREQSGVARLGLKRDGAREAPGAQRIDRVRADMRPDVDEHRLGPQPARRR